MAGAIVHSDALAVLRAALDRGAVSEALDSFGRLLAATPMVPDVLAWVRRGWTTFAASDDADARLDADLNAATRQSRAARLLLARVAHGNGFPAIARALGEGLTADGPDGAATFLRCAMLLKGGDPTAQVLLQTCLAEFPEPSHGWSDLGLVLLELGKRQAGLLCLGRGIPSFPLAMRRGLLARDLGRLDVARSAFAEAVAMNPKTPRAWFLLGTCAQDARDYPAAAVAYAEVLALDPATAEAAVNLGTVRQEVGDLDGARQAYRQAVQARPDTFGRVAQALATSPKGELWLDLGSLRRDLAS